MYKKLSMLLVLCSAALSASVNPYNNDSRRLSTLCAYCPLAREHYLPALKELVDASGIPSNKIIIEQRTDLPLYQYFPDIQKSIPSISLGTLPTPIKVAHNAARELNVGWLGIKCDDSTGIPGSFGGNKERKAEFLIADALLHEADAVLTTGCIGSNHVTLIADVAKRSGFVCYAMLTPQPVARTVQRNLKLMAQNGARMYLYANAQERQKGIVATCIQHKITHGKFPYVIPTGGSCPLGTVGYVNAAFELKQQIEQGLLPEPDIVYVSCGSMGTAAGLYVGFKAARINSQIILVCTENKNPATFPNAMLDLIHKTNELLHEADPSFPIVEIAAHDISVIYNCCGPRYGMFTAEGAQAMTLLKSTEGITLDGTYTAKGFAGLAQDAALGKLAGKKVLFWNTYCADCKPESDDYTQLGREFYTYFEQDDSLLEDSRYN